MLKMQNDSLKNFIIQSIFKFQIGNFTQLYSYNSQILSSIAGGVPNATWHAFSVFTHRSIKENEDLGNQIREPYEKNFQEKTITQFTISLQVPKRFTKYMIIELIINKQVPGRKDTCKLKVGIDVATHSTHFTGFLFWKPRRQEMPGAELENFWVLFLYQ